MEKRIYDLLGLGELLDWRKRLRRERPGWGTGGGFSLPRCGTRAGGAPCGPRFGSCRQGVRLNTGKREWQSRVEERGQEGR